LKTRFQTDSNKLHVEEFMPTIIKSSKEQAWIGVPSVETWISCPLLNAIPLKNFYIELMLIFVYKISSSTNNNLSVTMFG
jgi:hypothetical protein